MNEEETTTVYTIEDYLYGKVKFNVPEEALKSIMADRGIESGIAFADRDKDAVRLAYADILKWYLVGHSKQNNVSDGDNGWSHSGGGYELDDGDKKLLKAEANAIYNELEPVSVIKGGPTFKITSFGVCRANYDVDGAPLPRINK